MMEVKAVIRPNKLPLLRAALMDTPGFPGMTVAKVEGCSAPSKAAKLLFEMS
jgi:nitrogen regulatory protein P-II 1